MLKNAPRKEMQKAVRSNGFDAVWENRRYLPDTVSTLYSEQYSQSTYTHLVSEEALLFWMALLFEA